MVQLWLGVTAKERSQQPRRRNPRSTGQRPPKSVGEHPRVVVGTDLHIRCLSCGLRAALANRHPRWAFLRNQGPPPEEERPQLHLLKLGGWSPPGWSGLAEPPECSVVVLHWEKMHRSCQAKQRQKKCYKPLPTHRATQSHLVSSVCAGQPLLAPCNLEEEHSACHKLQVPKSLCSSSKSCSRKHRDFKAEPSLSESRAQFSPTRIDLYGKAVNIIYPRSVGMQGRRVCNCLRGNTITIVWNMEMSYAQKITAQQRHFRKSFTLKSDEGDPNRFKPVSLLSDM